MGLAKWLIALSTGAVVFSVNIVKPTTSMESKNILLLGLCFLVVTILTGVKYVRLHLDGMQYNLNYIAFATAYDKYSKHLNHEDTELFNGKRRLVSDVLKELNDSVILNREKMDNVNVVARKIFPIHQASFYIGIIMIAIFGLFNL